MKEKYTTPELEIIVLLAEDIITASNESPIIECPVDFD